jgi:hypothetical protein
VTGLRDMAAMYIFSIAFQSTEGGVVRVGDPVEVA